MPIYQTKEQKPKHTILKNSSQIILAESGKRKGGGKRKEGWRNEKGKRRNPKRTRWSGRGALWPCVLDWTSGVGTVIFGVQSAFGGCVSASETRAWAEPGEWKRKGQKTPLACEFMASELGCSDSSRGEAKTGPPPTESKEPKGVKACASNRHVAHEGFGLMMLA